MADENKDVNVVPKADFERVKAEADEAKRGLDGLKAQLLTPDYMEFLEAKKNPKPPAVSSDLKNLDVSKMSMSELSEKISKHTLDSVLAALGPQIRNMNKTMTDVVAKLELEDVRQEFADFDEYRAQTSAILENSGNDLTIKQAYLIAKQTTKPTAIPGDKKDEKAPKGNEKPGSIIPVEGDSIKTFKNASEASAAAAKTVLEKHGITGDFI